MSPYADLPARRSLQTLSDAAIFAARTVARRSLPELARLGVHVGDAWRRGDPETVHALAAVELRSLGLRAPD